MWSRTTLPSFMQNLLDLTNFGGQFGLGFEAKIFKNLFWIGFNDCEDVLAFELSMGITPGVNIAWLFNVEICFAKIEQIIFFVILS